MTLINIKDSVIGYDDLGKGEPVVLIHGHPFNRSMWSPQTSMLKTTHRVITPDLRGYGESSVTKGKVRLEDHVTDVRDVLKHLNVDRIVLGGFSMGGQIAMEFYRQFPKRVHALLLVDTFAQLDTPKSKENRYETANRVAREGMNDYAVEVLPKMISPANIENQPLVAAHVLNMIRNTDPEGAAASLRGRAERRDYVPLLSKITAPTLIVVGRDDEFTPVRDGELMHNLIPNSKLVVIDDASHMPNLERELEFNTILWHWLSSLTLPHLSPKELL